MAKGKSTKVLSASTPLRNLSKNQRAIVRALRESPSIQNRREDLYTEEEKKYLQENDEEYLDDYYAKLYEERRLAREESDRAAEERFYEDNDDYEQGDEENEGDIALADIEQIISDMDKGDKDSQTLQQYSMDRWAEVKAKFASEKDLKKELARVGSEVIENIQRIDDVGYLGTQAVGLWDDIFGLFNILTGQAISIDESIERNRIAEELRARNIEVGDEDDPRVFL